MSQPISPDATRMVVYTLFDKVANRPLAEVADGFVFAFLSDREPQVTEYLTMDDALDAVLRAGGDVKVLPLTKWVEPAR